MEENNDEYQHIEPYRYNLNQPRAATNSKDGETKSQLDADSREMVTQGTVKAENKKKESNEPV